MLRAEKLKMGAEGCKGNEKNTMPKTNYEKYD